MKREEGVETCKEGGSLLGRKVNMEAGEMRGSRIWK